MCFIYVKNAVVFATTYNFITNKTLLLCVILGTIVEIFYQLHLGLYQLSLYLNSADLFFCIINEYLLSLFRYIRSLLDIGAVPGRDWGLDLFITQLKFYNL